MSAPMTNQVAVSQTDPGADSERLRIRAVIAAVVGVAAFFGALLKTMIEAEAYSVVGVDAWTMLLLAIGATGLLCGTVLTVASQVARR